MATKFFFNKLPKPDRTVGVLRKLELSAFKLVHDTPPVEKYLELSVKYTHLNLQHRRQASLVLPPTEVRKLRDLLTLYLATIE